MTKIRLLDCLKRGATRIALIVLRTELTDEEVDSHLRKLGILWGNSAFTCAAQAGCSFLYENFSKLTGDRKASGNPWIPELITSNMELMDQKATEFFLAFPDVRVDQKDNQHETNFMMALRLVVEEIEEKNLKVDMIVAVGSGKGRLDHNMGNINTLFVAPSLTKIPVLLMSEQSVQYVIPGGCQHELLLDTGLEGRHCGLIPLQGPSIVTSTGLRWDLTGQKLEFGGLISTSNELVEKSVTVESDLPILWTMSVKEPERSASPA